MSRHTFANRGLSIATQVAKRYQNHLYLYTVGLLGLYLIVFQFRFVTSGDIWAEAFCEYVNGAVNMAWEGFFKTGIAGYYNFLPKLVSYPYVIFGLPVGLIDHFFRIVIVAYAAVSVGFIAHGYNRYLIKSDWLRVMTAFLVLLTLYHVSTFGLINVWYVGFIPVILVSLSPQRFSHEWQEVLYAGYALAISTSKPSLILLPLVIYRTVRLREYLLGSIIVFGIVLQMLLFFSSSYYAYWTEAFADIHISLLRKAANTLLYPGLVFMKFFKIPALTFWLVPVFSALIAGLVVIVVKAKGYLMAGLLTLTLLLASYTALYPSDTPPVASVKAMFDTLYYDEMKLQREVMLTVMIVILLIVAVDYLVRQLRGKQWKWHRLTALILPLLLISVAYRPIDVESSKLSINIDPFRASLTAREDVCMPVPPTPTWKGRDYTGPTSGWYYESWLLGSCLNKNYDKTIDAGSFQVAIGAGQGFGIDVDGHLTTVMIPVSNPDPGTPHRLTLTNTKTGRQFSANIKAKSINDPISHVAFNLTKEPYQDKYHYILTESGTSRSSLKLGTFTDRTRLYYAYSIKYDTKRER